MTESNLPPLPQSRFAKGNPIVVPEYKLIFFPMPKVACTEWKMIMQRMMGMSNDERYGHVHIQETNGLTYLKDYSLEKIHEMLLNDEWTKAVFVREPKQRILSAFLDKYFNHPGSFDMRCCEILSGQKQEECKRKLTEDDYTGHFSHFLHLASTDCKDEHWNPQVDNLDLGYWRTINFVGYFENMSADVQLLLSSLSSSKTGETAWNKYGRTGWGENGTSPFLGRNSAKHSTGASDKMGKYYSPEDEKYVEMHWGKEWNQDYYHFDPIHLFD